MRRLTFIFLTLIFLTFYGCGPSIDLEGEGDISTDIEYQGLVHKIFKESTKSFPNPERGIYAGRDWHSETDAPLTAQYVSANRLVCKTLIYTGYYLTDFMESDISDEYLELIRTNMKVLRSEGMKCILRFAYKTDMYETGHPWDASPKWVHRHIEQIKPILQENSDVILCLQAGFIGVWGEWAYTDNFVMSPKTPEEHALRKDVMMALLDAMPTDRQVALRTPMFKKRMFLDSYADSITLGTAHDGSDLSRICGHNDCFGADATDMGTFTETGSRELWKNETRYVLMGGETCKISKYSKCSVALEKLKGYHWTYLSPSNGRVNSEWLKEGCYKEVERRLGYRLYITDVYSTSKAAPGGLFRVVVKLHNTGFAAPMNPRKVELVLTFGDGKKEVYALEDIDPRFWFAGERVTIDREIRLPEEAHGECTIYFNLPDAEQTLYSNPRFSIRLANDDVWNEEEGYNKIIEFTL